MDKHPVLHLERGSQVHWGTSYLMGTRDTRKQNLCRGMSISRPNQGQDHHTDKIRHGNTLLGKLSDGIMELCGEQPPIRSLQGHHHKLYFQRDRSCWGGRIIILLNERQTSSSTILLGTNPQRLWRKWRQTCWGYEQISYPVGNHAIFGRALKISQVFFCHRKCSFCLKTIYEFFLFKTMIFIH